MEQTIPATSRWWVPPVIKLLLLFGALAAAGVAIWLAVRNVNAPSASELLNDYGYLGVAVGAFADSFGLPSSGEVVLLLASAASAAATAYVIGRAAGPRVLHRFGVGEDSAVHGFMERHGMRAVAAGRLVAGIRTKLAVVSGSTRMPVHRYMIADAIGAAVWAVSVGLLGYLFSSSVNRLVDRFGSASHVLGVVAVAVVAVAAVYLSVRYVLRHRPDPAPGPGRQ
jgi:membrane protein DedA with SNARE-associated domain